MPRGNPQPWFRPSRNTWYVTFGGVQHNLRTADKEEAFRLWHEMMAHGETVSAGDGTAVVDLLALFADHCERHKAAATYEWYRRSANASGSVFAKRFSKNRRAYARSASMMAARSPGVGCR